MNRWATMVACLALAGCGAPARISPAAAPDAAAAASAPRSAPGRPIPYPVVPPEGFQAAVEAGTRTTTGEPGPRYWTNGADYRIRVRLMPEAKRLEGSEVVRYHNRSPDTLQVLVMDLVQNFHAPGTPRLEPAEVTGGVELKRVVVQGQRLQTDLRAGPRFQREGTKLYIAPPGPVLPGQTVELELDWAFNVPQAGAGGRMGYSGGDLFYLAYFYPQMSVYDDVAGWQTDPFLGPGEFYADFGRFDVEVEAPAGWLVMGTGSLTNAADVLAPDVLARLRLAEQSDTVVRVLTAADLPRATRASTGRVTWSFRADSVRDVAFSLTRRSVWDAARTEVGDRDGDGRPDHARVDAIYRQQAVRWRQAARYAQHSLRALARFTDTPYPWPHMTAVEGEGIIGGGMEYPMMTLIGSYTAASDSALYAVIAHEFAHMWVPMIVSTDERRFGWMDEGTTDFNEIHAYKEFYPGSLPELRERQSYLGVALRGEEGELMRRTDYHYPGAAGVTASYFKPATVLFALRGLLGEETFRRAYLDFYDRWSFRHPYPWDLWNTFERASGRDLDWFWRTWYYETWLLDQAVGQVSVTGDRTTIVVEDRGNAPMPARLSVTLTDGSVVRREVPVEQWLAGSRTATVTVPGRAARVEIDAENVFPDADRTNNVWMAPR